LLLCGAFADEIADHHEPSGDAYADFQRIWDAGL